MDINLVGENLKFVVLGMAIVLVFQFIMKHFRKSETSSQNNVSETVSTPRTDTIINDNLDVTQDAHHVAAIVAAITEFRKQS
jgi:Na+-transporting methylmalonyl-CoA/oxaloacetate decarboxylase gamma subunit